MFRFLFATFICLLIDHEGSAQASAVAHASATIVNPVSTARKKDMSFGVFTTGPHLGSIMLQNTGVLIPKGSIRLLQSNQPQQVATFNIAGNNDYCFDVLLPASAGAIRKNGFEILMVEAFTTTRKIMPDNVVTVEIGATLKVPSFSKAGEYIDRSQFEIMVSYN